MADYIELDDFGTFVPIQDTVCECNHWYKEHSDGSFCNSPDCPCECFVADVDASQAEAIADRGGDPRFWPEHVKIHFLQQAKETLMAEARERERASGLIYPSPQDVAEQIRHGLRNPNVTLALVSPIQLSDIEDDHNENDWRAKDTQAVSFHVVTYNRDFLVTVEDITYDKTQDEQIISEQTQ